jgi:NAD(P)-dependent dehydrogenase (short-subunit alcohol dehydrogenase family)
VVLLLLTRHLPVLQVALVTGGSSGIGLEISRQLGEFDVSGVSKIVQAPSLPGSQLQIQQPQLPTPGATAAAAAATLQACMEQRWS